MIATASVGRKRRLGSVPKALDGAEFQAVECQLINVRE
jgi:hypothetical protein